MDKLTEILRSPERLAALRRLNLLDTEPEPAFDRLTRLATTIYHVPVSLVVLLDQDRQFFKSCRGLPDPWCARRETPLSHAFCQHILVSRQPLVLEDARLHPDFINQPAIEDLGVIAYLGLPLIAVDGAAIGSFCVIDSQPRQWSAQDIELLTQLAGLVMYEIEARVERAEREKIEQALQQAQKLESLGRMAGGLAHDFNNFLMTISGYTELAAGELPQQHPARADLAEVMQTTERATRLVRHMLAFARQQFLRPQVLSLNEVVARLEPLLRPLLHEHIACAVQLDPALSSVKVDPLQIEQIVINVAVNARDAMPRGGTLTLTTANVLLDAEAARRLNISAGRYATLTLSDTGAGMPPEVQARACDPFFTTKAPGLGSGLGLAISYGIARQHGGHLLLASEQGRGTQVTLYLPVTAGVAETAEPAEAGALPRGNEQVARHLRPAAAHRRRDARHERARAGGAPGQLAPAPQDALYLGLRRVPPRRTAPRRA
jgi:signal transduction histidine kinase